MIQAGIMSMIGALLLTVGVTLALINVYPAAFLLSNETSLLPGWSMWLVPAVDPLCYWLGYRFWMYGVNKYQGVRIDAGFIFTRGC